MVLFSGTIPFIAVQTVLREISVFISARELLRKAEGITNIIVSAASAASFISLVR